MNHTYKVHTEETGKSMAIRLLIHYVGDFHQPLHCSSAVNDEFPKGDRGGNSFKLPASDQGELHAVWDSVALEFADSMANEYGIYGYATLPFSDDDWAAYGNIAQRYRDTYDIEDAVAKDLDVFQWAADDFKIAKEFLYKGIKQNEELPQNYIDGAKQIAEKQVLIGGLRLANLLKSLNLSAKSVEEELTPKFLF